MRSPLVVRLIALAIYTLNKYGVLCFFVGRRHLQVRLVEPSLKSLNSGDCFALVTEKDLFSWIGKDCNPYEKAKVTKIICLLQTISCPCSNHYQLALQYLFLA